MPDTDTLLNTCRDICFQTRLLFADLAQVTRIQACFWKLLIPDVCETVVCCSLFLLKYSRGLVCKIKCYSWDWSLFSWLLVCLIFNSQRILFVSHWPWHELKETGAFTSPKLKFLRLTRQILNSTLTDGLFVLVLRVQAEEELPSDLGITV